MTTNQCELYSIKERETNMVMKIWVDYLESISPLRWGVGGFQVQKLCEHQLVIGGMWSTLKKRRRSFSGRHSVTKYCQIIYSKKPLYQSDENQSSSFFHLLTKRRRGEDGFNQVAVLPCRMPLVDLNRCEHVWSLSTANLLHHQQQPVKNINTHWIHRNIHPRFFPSPLPLVLDKFKTRWNCFLSYLY